MSARPKPWVLLTASMRVGGGRVYALGLVAMFGGLAVSIAGYLVSGSLLWFIAVLIGVLVGIGCTAWSSGYRAARPDEVSRLRAGKVWHVANRAGVAGDLLELDPAWCQTTSRMLRGDRVGRPLAASYLFAAEPDTVLIRANLSRRHRTIIFELEAHDLPDHVFVRGDAIALTQPARFRVLSVRRLP